METVVVMGTSEAGGLLAFGLRDAVVQDPPREVDAGGGDAVLELHRVVDLVAGEASVGGLHEVEGEDAASDGRRGALAEVVQVGGDGAVARLAALGRVGDPVRRVAVDGGDG